MFHPLSIAVSVPSNLCHPESSSSKNLAFRSVRPFKNQGFKFLPSRLIVDEVCRESVSEVNFLPVVNVAVLLYHLVRPRHDDQFLPEV